MPFDIDEKVDLTQARTVTLAGRELKVAPLPLRQVIAISDVVPNFAALNSGKVGAEAFDPLVEVVWRGLLRAYPQLTKDELLDLPITMADLVAAVSVVIEQAGGRKEGAAGEQRATSTTEAPNGASSSPIS
jgi:hypothetical protein